MDEISFEDKLNHILDRIRELPANKATEAADSAEARRDRVQHSMDELQEALDYLRLSVMYLVFDLEATRRENNYLRRIIEQSNRSRGKAEEPQDKPQDKPQDGQGEGEHPDFGANGWE
jgi:ElaB/YqjD/DUF883 family membrane-anchored ribosome-binding protein